MATKAKLLENMQTDSNFISNMDSVFRDLRADFDVSSLVYAKNKIEELKKINIDTTGDVSTLATLSVASNGVISGRRGTGKSHLLLLARNEINVKKDSFCVYINLKEHFNIGGTPVLDERFYVWVILTQLRKQLKLLSSNDAQKGQNPIKLILSFFDKSDAKIEANLNAVFNEMDVLISYGEKELNEFNVEKTSEKKQEHSSSYEIAPKITLSSVELSGKIGDSSTETFGENSKYHSGILLNTNTLKSLLVRVVEVLSLKSIVFYYDEWSARSRSEQEKLSKLIQALSTSPIFHWIAYIPYKSSLGVLELSADMPHQIELDLKYIYEENNQVCSEYFFKFANKRFDAVFGEGVYSIENIFSKSFIDILILACMGNTRDFGILLHKSWTNYKTDVLAKKRCRIINKQHIVKAIKSLSKEKVDNLHNQGNIYSQKLWNEIIKFVGEKKHTHFCIELNRENQTYLSQEELQDLLYHRLIHLRKNDLPPKEGGEYRLSMYAVDISTIYSRIYETRSESRQIKIVTDINVVHNQIRRYVFDLGPIVSEYRIEQGKQIICTKCNRAITSEMSLAWQMMKCPYCMTSF